MSGEVVETQPASGPDDVAVTAVIATRSRPVLLREALASVDEQDLDNELDAIVVYDGTEPDRGLSLQRHPLRVVRNTRTPGLAGARNTGILAARGDMVAFCDDDDTWRPDRLSRQLEAMAGTRALGAVGGVRIRYGDVIRDRVPEVAALGTEVLRSRLTGAHPSTFLFRRDALLGPVGLVDEALPHGYGEDYDLLIRAARAGDVIVVQDVLADVLWHPGSYFAQRWDGMAEGLAHLLRKHPQLAEDRRTRGWVEGQRAFALAASGRRRAALRTALRSGWADPRQPRAWLAVLVAGGVLEPRRVLHELNRRGRGI